MMDNVATTKPLVVVIRKPRTVEEFEQYYDVRYKVLREPLDLPRESEKARPVIHEFAGVHLFACVPTKKAAVGAVMGYIEHGLAKVHALCILPEYQRSGLGKALMLALEDELRKQGANRVYLNSRVPIQPFYEKLGYVAVRIMPREESIRVTGMDLVFVRMEKSLVSTKI